MAVWYLPDDLPGETIAMEFRVLRYFLTVVREGTITGAARALHVTQPTLSRQLMELEEELGRTLFLRSNHAITLTPEGMLFRKRAEEIMAMVRKTESEFQATGERIGGAVHIGGGETDAMKLVAEIMREIRDEYPGIHFHVHSGNAVEVTERLDKGLLDFGVLIQPVNIDRYESVALPVKDVWGVVVRRDHPLAGRGTVTAADLSGEPLICSRQVVQAETGKNPCMEWFGRDWDGQNIVATYNLIFNAALLVEAGVGCAIAIDKLLNVTGSGNLCFLPLRPRLESGLDVVWKKSQVFSPASRIFLERIRRRFVSEISTGGGDAEPR